MDFADVKLIKSPRRKSMSLQVTKDADVVMRMPSLMPEFMAKKFWQKNFDWVDKQLKKRQKELQENPPRSFSHGEEFYYLGNKVRLHIVEAQWKPLEFKDHFYISKRFTDNAKGLLKIWYESEAFKVISKRVRHYAEQHNWKYQQIRLSNAETRWGSCSSRGTMRFSWKLVMAPLAVIDYVVVHELAHLKHLNHSSKFWREVEQMMPVYRVHRRWLKRNGHLLEL
jgi:hypothetical protein